MKLLKKTTGYKTYATATMYILVALFGEKVPFLKDNKVIVEQCLEYAFEFAVAHKVFRSSWDWIKNKKPHLKIKKWFKRKFED
jgi:hypothetical protein